MKQIKINGKNVNQICPECAKKYGVIINKPTKGICNICGSTNSWSIK